MLLNLSIFTELMVQIPLPRKGTETRGLRQYYLLPPAQFKFHYPERGRKPVLLKGDFHLFVIEGFKFHYPERGRKR